MAKGYKRRNIFIKKDFQGKLILSTFLLVMGGGLLFMAMFTLFSADTLTISYTNNDLQFGQTPLMLIKQALIANWILIAIGGTILVIAAMIFSHRIAGPMFRFEKTLDNMISGRLNDQIHLRGADEGKELAAKINQFNADLSKSLRTINHNTKAIEALIEQAITFNLPENDKEILASLYWSMQEHNRKIKNTCDVYTLKDE
jgi:methyl-accepting chemotaxis protein